MLILIFKEKTVYFNYNLNISVSLILQPIDSLKLIRKEVFMCNVPKLVSIPIWETEKLFFYDNRQSFILN